MRLVVISGCSGAGKSTLLDELAQRGFATVAEPGRRIIEEELAGGRHALPWVDMSAFLRRVVDMSLHDIASLETANRIVFFDRGIGDAIAALEHIGEPVPRAAVVALQKFDTTAFLAPPWEEIFSNDEARRHSFADAREESDRLARFYPRYGFRVETVPKTTVAARAAFLLDRLDLA